MVFLALNSNNQETLISEAAVHQPYYCPACGGGMICKLGERNAWHFAHRGDESGNCTLGGPQSHQGKETFNHIHAKGLVKMFLERGREIGIRKECSRCFTTKVDKLTAGNARVELEYRLIDNSVADVAIIEDDRLTVIEILHSHRTVSRPIPRWYELKAEDVLASINQPTLLFDCQRRDRTCRGGCMSMKDLAIELGHLVWRPRVWEELRILWNDNPMEYRWVIRSSVKSTQLWKEFIRRGRCMRCCKRCKVERKIPFCRTCWLQVADDEAETINVMPTFDKKEEVWNKYCFLKDIARVEDTSCMCVRCQSKLNQDRFGSRPVFFFGQRQICYSCLG